MVGVKTNILLIVLASKFLSVCQGQDGWSQKSLDTLPLKTTEAYNPTKKNVKFTYHKIETRDKDCKLYVKETGPKEGSPIVFLHGGWGMEHSPFVTYFAHQLDLVSKHRLIFYDQRGSLRSPCKNYDSISVTKHVKDLERIRKKLGIDSFRIVAWSMGSFLAYNYINKHEKHVDDLLIIGPLPILHHDSLCESAGVDVKKKMWDRPAYQKVLDQTGLKGRKKSSYNPKEMALYNKVSLAGMNLYHVDRWRCFEGAYGVNRKARIAAGKSMKSHWNFERMVEELPFTPFFIGGDYDYVSQSYCDYLKRFQQTRNIKFFYLEKAGHTAWIDRPETVKNIIENRWLKN